MFAGSAHSSRNGRWRFRQRLPIRPDLGAGVLMAALGVFLALLGGAGCASGEVETAPGFSLPAAHGREVALTQLLQEHEAVVLVFYRGFF